MLMAAPMRVVTVRTLKWRATVSAWWRVRAGTRLSSATSGTQTGRPLTTTVQA
jgi:hypothetical protein